VADHYNPPEAYRVTGTSDPVTTPAQCAMPGFMPFCRTRWDIEYPIGAAPHHFSNSCDPESTTGSIQLVQTIVPQNESRRRLLDQGIDRLGRRGHRRGSRPFWNRPTPDGRWSMSSARSRCTCRRTGPGLIMRKAIDGAAGGNMARSEGAAVRTIFFLLTHGERNVLLCWSARAPSCLQRYCCADRTQDTVTIVCIHCW